MAATLVALRAPVKGDSQPGGLAATPMNAGPHSHMSDIPKDAIAGNAPTYRCLLCGLKGRRAKTSREHPCPHNKHGHVWVHQVHIDAHRLGKKVPDHARRMFETYPEAMEARFVEDSTAVTTSSAPGEPPKRQE